MIARVRGMPQGQMSHGAVDWVVGGGRWVGGGWPSLSGLNRAGAPSCRVLCDRAGILTSVSFSYSRKAARNYFPTTTVRLWLRPTINSICLGGSNDFRRRAVCTLSRLAAASGRLVWARRYPATSLSKLWNECESGTDSTSLD